MFTKALENMAATEGHSVCLECAVNDATQVAWYKDGIIQRNTSDFKQTFDGLNAKLEIDEIFVDDHGEYACVAKNDFGENKTTCRINVKGENEPIPVPKKKPWCKVVQYKIFSSLLLSVNRNTYSKTTMYDNCDKKMEYILYINGVKNKSYLSGYFI